MPSRRERDEVDELIDALPIWGDADTVEQELLIEGEPQRRCFRMPRWLGFTVPIFTFLIGATLGVQGAQDNSSPPYATVPDPTVTVTTTATQPAVPAPCARALDIMARVSDYVSAIGAAGEEQLDISHAARQAIYLKDWQALDAAMHRQTELNNRLDEPTAKAFSVSLELRDAMKECADATD